jgi:glycosyltransferase involved in cell wall biosynthesis
MVINGFEKKYKEVKVLKLEKNMGLGNALNQGIKICSNELIARMDADDISTSNRFELQVNRFLSNPKLILLGGQIQEFKEIPFDSKSKRIVPSDFASIKIFAKLRSPFNHPTVMFKKSNILSIGGYRTLSRKEDLELFLRIVFRHNFYSENLRDVLLHYRTNDSNYKRRKNFINVKEYINVMRSFYKSRDISLFDLVKVIFLQVILFFIPLSFQKYLYIKIFRK